MDANIGVHPRVNKRHSEVSNKDVVAAMRAMICYTQRPTGDYIAVGVDSKSRLLEIVYQYDEEEDYFFVYHAMTPPTGKTYKELGIER